ncbi:MAG TPA: hypothetical protein VK559_02760 [Ferruginibacter sp.]|nr:hypothetical protein [Ferruginibacter sp.]
MRYRILFISLYFSISAYSQDKINTSIVQWNVNGTNIGNQTIFNANSFLMMVNTVLEKTKMDGLESTSIISKKYKLLYNDFNKSCCNDTFFMENKSKIFKLFISVRDLEDSLMKEKTNEDHYKHEEETELAYNIKSLIYKVPFNSTFSEVLSYEFGESHSDSISCNSLPIAIECTGQKISYYWRYVKDSKMGEYINSFLKYHGFKGNYSDNSYIVYGFKNDQLIRVNLRLFPWSHDFEKQFFNSLGQDTLNYPERDQVQLDNDIYCITGSSFNDIKSTEISMCNKVGYNICVQDWWHQ